MAEFSQRRPDFDDEDDLTVDGERLPARAEEESIYVEAYPDVQVRMTGDEAAEQVRRQARGFFTSWVAYIPTVILGLYTLGWLLVTVLFWTHAGISRYYTFLAGPLGIILYPMGIVFSFIALAVMTRTQSLRGIVSSVISLFVLLIYPLFGLGQALRPDSAYVDSPLWWFTPIVLAAIGFMLSLTLLPRARKIPQL